jgi:GAF domain-containing protein
MTSERIMDSSHETSEDRVDKLLFSLSSLGDIGEALTSTEDFSAILRSLLHLVLGVLTISKGAILLFDRESHTLSVQAARGLGRTAPTIHLKDEWVQILVRENRPLSRFDLERLLKSMTSRYTDELDMLQVYLWVPLMVRKQLLGVLSVSERFMKISYTDDELALLATISRHIAVGISNHILIEEIQAANFRLDHKVLELDMLHDVGMAITSVLDISSLVNEILIRLVGLLDVQGGFLMLKDETTGELDIAACIGIEERVLQQTCLARGGDLLSEVMRTGNSQMLNGLAERLRDAPCRNLMVFPLKGGEEILGVLGVVDKESREAGVVEFTEEDERLAYSFANQAGIAVANARLYKTILDEKNSTQSILTSISSGVISTDLEGRIVSVNHSARRILGVEDTFESSQQQRNRQAHRLCFEHRRSCAGKSP